MIILLAFGFIRLLDVYYFPRRRQRIQQEADRRQQEERNRVQRESFRRRLDTLSNRELLILAYCLSRNRITFFVARQEKNFFADAINTLEVKGYFIPAPANMMGSPHNIPEDMVPGTGTEVGQFALFAKNRPVGVAVSVHWFVCEGRPPPSATFEFRLFDRLQATAALGPTG